MLPNILTILRLVLAACLPLTLLIWRSPQVDWILFWLFTIGALTDYFDGWAARKLHALSRLGTMLDPIGDKALIALGFVTLAAMYGPVWWLFGPAVLILTREFVVSGLREYLGPQMPVPVSRLAKWKTSVQLLAIALIFLSGALNHGLLMLAGQTTLWLAALLTLMTGMDYLQKGLRSMREEA